MRMVKPVLIEVSDVKRALQGSGLEATQLTFWQRTRLHFVYALRLHERAEFKGDTMV
jgi:hypothetical protein